MTTNPPPGSSDIIEKPSELDPRKLWETEIQAAEKEMEKFYERGDMANNRFLDERDIIYADAKWFNIYYANTNILESALYSQIPKPSVERKYKDYQDQVARVGALILQRSLEQDINDPEDTFDTVMRQTVQDRLIPGMGNAWLRLETETEDIPEQEGGVVTNTAMGTQPKAKGESDGFTSVRDEVGPIVTPMKRIKDQKTVVDYVHWKDFIYSPCRTWSERRWVGRKVYMTRDQLVKRFGAAKGNACQLDYSHLDKNKLGHTPNPEGPTYEVFKKAIVYEIWDRTTRKVIWFSKGYAEGLLDSREDFLKLQSFEPCPTPMFANITTTNCIPRPDYYMIQDQYSELNVVNSRISLLVQACKVVGVYDQSSKALQQMLQGNENTMIPVENWGQFSEKGGMKGVVDWLPLDQIVATLQRLYESREAIKGQIYELTGIADIVRGASKASETLGAQEIKAQFASIRIKKLQDEVARFASEILRIKAEIQVKHYTPDTLIRRSGIVYTDNAEWVPEALALIKSEQGFKWRVKVQADTMAQADYDAEKKDRIEFMSMVTGYMANALPIAGQIPELKPVILGLLKWGMAGFKRSQDIEGMIDKQLSQLEGKPPPPPKEDPKVVAAKMKAEQDQQKGQMEQQKMQQEAQIAAQESQMEMAAKQEEMAMKREEMQLDMQAKQMELDFKREELQLKGEENQMNLQAKSQEHQLNMETSQQVAQQKVQDSMVQSDIQRRQGEQQLELSAKQGEQQLEQKDAAGKQDLQMKKAQASALPKSTAKKGKS